MPQDFHNLEDSRLQMVADTLGQYSRIGSEQIAAASGILNVLQAAVVTVDMAYDLDCMSAAAVIPEKVPPQPIRVHPTPPAARH